MAADDNNTTQEAALEAVCRLMTARIAGTTSDETIEAAVARLLPATPAHAEGDVEPGGEEENDDDSDEDGSDDEKPPPIHEDLEDYDDDDDDETANAPSQAKKRKQQGTDEKNANGPEKKKRKRRKDAKKRDWSAYYNLPFGKQGAQMLGTFGDSREPLIETIEAALESTKKLVQGAVDDARKLRIEYANNLADAQRSMRKHRPEKPENKGEWSAEMMYRALGRKSRSDNLDKESFTVEELKILYAEEMNVYDRWRLLREKVDRSKGDDAVKAEDADEEEDEEEEEEEDNPVKEKGAAAAGRLVERSEQFDIRTHRMKQKPYLEFSEIRRGSFLGHVSSTTDRSGSGKGKWATLAPTYLRFLLWCGFDPQSSEPPPEAPTIEALAFLAYSFLGRVVETAVRLRNEKANRSTKVVEIVKGDHLHPEDIESAMEHPDMKSSRIFESQTVGAQLYFGPGFENRLEVELEQMVKAAKSRKEERLPPDDVFAHLDPRPGADSEGI